MAARRSAEATRRIILQAAARLFATRGVHGTSVRQIAAEAGVDHALVLRYFGTKEAMLAQILRQDALTMTGMAGARGEDAPSFAALEEVYRFVLGEGGATTLLLLRAEMDGLSPERLLEGVPLPPQRLAAWLAARGAGEAVTDPRAVAMVLSAALFGLAAARPLLASMVGYGDEDPAMVLQHVVAALVAMTAGAAGTGRPPDAAAAP